MSDKRLQHSAVQPCEARRCLAPGCRPASPSHTKDHRNGLFGTIQGYEAGSPSLDAWMGNALVDPKKGKLGLQPPTDPKGGAPAQGSHTLRHWIAMSI